MTSGEWKNFKDFLAVHVPLPVSAVLTIDVSFIIPQGNFGTVFVDQSYWQSSVAAKPRQGIWGFLSGGLVWFAVPFTFATTMGLSYIALSAREGQHLLTGDDVNAGQ